ncbi:TetR/AcrR family transcriptional regulator [Conexibacter sp. SYSU D00693]|uniref:TetR/AcrR family transcriptional regulator n=1 Tax=Conexibacter sp. SYSU D00693 TaxID=2812560 RepID=UPI00196B33AA|nr:TetR/AcrR family transcriptional regulator [Conexibacter sp. SYSU D00693]
MPPVVRPYRGVSADERRAQRRAQLLDAALDVAGEAGLGALRVTAVCRRAGLTERYFYESFGDREALVRAVLLRCLQEAGAAVQAALDGAGNDLRDRCRALFGAALGVLLDDPRKARVYVEAVADPGATQLREQAFAAQVALLERELRAAAGPGLSRRRLARLRVAATVLVGGTSVSVVPFLAGQLPVSRGQLVDDFAGLCVAALAAD